MAFMASVFAHVFSCCLQRKPSCSSLPDERERLLIPAMEEPSAAQSSGNVLDQKRVRERLVNIVRSKEGKMVNVNARLPFNLHSKKLSSALDPSSSSSRSASMSTMGGPGFSPLSSTTQVSTMMHANVGAPLAPFSVHPSNSQQTGHEDLSRSSSIVSRETSGNDSSENYDYPATTQPLFNIRLVRTLPSGESGPLYTASRRGRSRKRTAAAVPNGSDATTPVLALPAGTPVDDTLTPRANVFPSSASSAGSSLPSSDDASPSALQSASPIGNRPTLLISPPSKVPFAIRDPGPLTVSWGD